MDGLYNIYVILFIGLQCACVRGVDGVRWVGSARTKLCRFMHNIYLTTLPFLDR